MRTPTRTRVICYARVSTDRQADRGTSLESQREKLAAYALAMDLEIVEHIEDAGQSAKTLDRPGLQRALAALRADAADAIVVVKLDRLTRSVRDLGTLLEDYFAAGAWALLSLGDSIDTRSAAGRLVLNVLASVSQWEREAIAERCEDGRAHKRARGGYVGGDAPYGFGVDAAGQLQPITSEQAVIARVRDLADCGLSVRDIAAKLAAAGVTSRTGKPFGKSQIARLIRREPPAMLARAA